MDKKNRQIIGILIGMLVVIAICFVGVRFGPGMGKRPSSSIAQVHIEKPEAERGAAQQTAAAQEAPAKQPTKKAERTGQEPKGPAISAEDIEKWMTMPKTEWQPLLEARAAKLPEHVRLELVALMREFQELRGKSGLGSQHPVYKGRRDSIIQRSNSRFEGNEENPSGAQ